MLVLSRQRDESVIICCNGEIIKVTVIDTRDDKTRLGFEANKEVIVHREEVWDAIQRKKEGELTNDDASNRRCASGCALEHAEHA